MADRSSGPSQIQGEAPHDATVQGNPVLIGGRSSAAAPSDVSGDGDATQIWVDRAGRQVVSPNVPGTLANGTQTTVSTSAVEVLAANASRKGAIVQNVGTIPMRVGVTGVTATTGVRVDPGDALVFEMPFCPTAALFAIRDGASDTTALTQEVT